MIWINYLIRVPVAAVVATIFMAFVFIIMIIWGIFIDWERHAGDEFKDLPEDWLTLFRDLSGIRR